AELARDAGELRGSTAFRSRPVQHGDVAELLREPVRDLTGAVGRSVADHEHAHAVFAERANHSLEVLPLVVGGQADDCVHAHIIAAWPRHRRGTPTLPTNSTFS